MEDARRAGLFEFEKIGVQRPYWDKVTHALLARVGVHKGCGCWELLDTELSRMSERTVPMTSILGKHVQVRALFMSQVGKSKQAEEEQAQRAAGCTWKHCVNPNHFEYGRPRGNTSPRKANQHRPKGVVELRPRRRLRESRRD